MKKLLKLTFILSLVLTFHLNTLAQHQFGVKVSGGISKITNSLELPDASRSTLFVPSGQAGFYYNHSLGKKSSLGAELLFSQIEGKEKWEVDLKGENGNTIGQTTALLYSHISYLSLPVYYGFKMNRLTINAGAQVSYALSSSGRNKVFSEYNGTRHEFLNRKITNLGFKDINFGPRVGANYQLSDKLSIEGMYYYGINNLYDDKTTKEEFKVQQLTFGIRYALKSRETVNAPSSGEQQMGIKVGGGLSRITNSSDMQKNLTTQFVPSGQGGFYYNWTLGNKSSIGLELLFSQIEGKEKSEGLNMQEGVYIIDGINNIPVPTENNFYSHISYLSLPMYCGVKIKKLTINGGVQLSYAIAASGLSKSIGTRNGQAFSQETKTDHLDVDKLDFGPRVGVVYPLNDKLAVEGTYYYGFNNIHTGSSASWKLRVQQMTVGIRYALWTNSKIQ